MRTTTTTSCTAMAAESGSEPAFDGPQRDELQMALHERLVQTGEWHRVMATLRASLDESGWTAALRDEAQSQASQQQKLSLPELVEDLTPFAEKTIPDHVRQQITAILHDFVSRNVEDA